MRGRHGLGLRGGGAGVFAFAFVLAVAQPARADDDGAPHGAVYIDEWAGRDAAYRSRQVDVSAGPGVAYHALELPFGCLHRSWGAGAHVDVALEILRGTTPLLVHFETEVYSKFHSKQLFSEGVVRGTFLVSLHFL